jgi:predicted nucleic acid-binding protein
LIVIDASVTLAWLFEDERSALAQRVLTTLEGDEAVVPAIWPVEVQNVILMAERRGRLTAEAGELLSGIRALPIHIEAPIGIDATVYDLAKKYELTTYDAAYLELAVRHGCKLATLDKALARAARRENALFR